MTLLRGRFRLGCPKGLHSRPQHVYTTVFPSCRSIASCLASFRSSPKTWRSRDNVVSVTDSQGDPFFKSTIRVFRCLCTYRSTQWNWRNSGDIHTCIQAPFHLIRCRPGPGTSSNVVAALPFSCCLKVVSTARWWEREKVVDPLAWCRAIQCRNHVWLWSWEGISRVTRSCRRMREIDWMKPRRATASPAPSPINPNPALKYGFDANKSPKTEAFVVWEAWTTASVLLIRPTSQTS